MATPHYIAKLVDGQYILERQNLSWRLRQPGLLCAAATLSGFGAILAKGARRNTLALIAAGLFGTAWFSHMREIERAREKKVTSLRRGPSYQNDRTRGVSDQKPEDDIDEAAMESFPASDPMASRAG